MPPQRRREPRSPEHAAFGEAVRRLRLEAGLSQEELAERAGKDFTLIGGIERGQRNPSFETLLRIAAGLGTTIGAIAALADEVQG